MMLFKLLKQEDRPDRAREFRAIGQRCAELLKDGPPAVAHGDLLYDERGLPK